MASLSTVRQERTGDGRLIWTVDINETLAGVATEIEIQLLTNVRTVTMVMSSYAMAGDGSTIQPSWGVAAGFADSTDRDFRTKKSAANAAFDADMSTVRIGGIVDGILYLHPNLDAGVANTVRGTVTFVEGII